MLTQEKLKSLFHYDPDTGIFTRISEVHGRYGAIGNAVGYPTDRGYLRTKIKGKQYKMHRLAFLYMTGRMPEIVDHINRIRDDNRWCNLREASRQQSSQNRKTGGNSETGYKGVIPSGSGFKAAIRLNGVPTYSETYSTPEEAYLKYCSLAIEHFGDFACLN